MQIAVVSEIPADERNEAGKALRAAKTIRQSLLADDPTDGLNFTVNRTQWLSGENATSTPRHHHAFQQIRWSESGRLNYAPDQYVLEGDIGYFPRGAWYGPQLRDEGVSITFQFGFNGEKQHGSAFWDRYQAGALEKLKANGRFERGLYIDVDPDTGDTRERDSVDALYAEQYEMHTGQKFVVPAAGYDSAILIHPGAFEYYPAGAGVEIRRLGDFFDHPGPNADVRFSMARLSGGSYTCGPDRAQVAWATAPGLRIEGTTYPENTYLYSPRDEKAELTSSGPIEIYVVQFPRLD
jgi:hypothetical protein